MPMAAPSPIATKNKPGVEAKIQHENAQQHAHLEKLAGPHARSEFSTAI
jgi:hypothetical protein